MKLLQGKNIKIMSNSISKSDFSNWKKGGNVLKTQLRIMGRNLKKKFLQEKKTINQALVHLVYVSVYKCIFYKTKTYFYSQIFALQL